MTVIPFVYTVLCLNCEVVFNISARQCPQCGSQEWQPLTRWISDIARKQLADSLATSPRVR
jgi:RNA polymerase subunit RPABC4/transcription elongation factor Spt4